MKYKLLAINLLFIAIFTIYAQEDIIPSSVSKISANFESGKVLLEWKFPVDLNKNIIIYRHTSEISDKDALEKASQIALLTNSEESYIDIPVEGSYYYAIFLQDKVGDKIDIVFNNFRNFTNTPVKVIKEEIVKILRVEATPFSTSIVLNWEYDGSFKSTIKKVSIFRNIKPILNEDDKRSSIKIASVDCTLKKYTDTPLSNINYYYGVFIENEKDISYVPNVNVTIAPVFVEKENKIDNSTFSEYFVPLPLLSLTTDPKNGENFTGPGAFKTPYKIKYNKETISVIENDKQKFLDVYNKYKKNELNSFKKIPINLLPNEDLVEPEEFKVEYQSALNFFKSNNYAESLNIFEKLLTEKLESALKTRVLYYIGVIKYFLGDYNMSLLYLLSPNDSFKKEVSPYINSIYYILFPTFER